MSAKLRRKWAKLSPTGQWVVERMLRRGYTERDVECMLDKLNNRRTS